MEHVWLKSLTDAAGGADSQRHIPIQSLFCAEILSKQTLRVRVQVQLKVRRHKHLKKSEHRRHWENNRRTHTKKLSAGYVFLHLCQYSCITFLVSLASDLLISLFVKMTVAGGISLVPLFLRVGVRYPASQLIWQRWVDITLTAVTALL